MTFISNKRLFLIIIVTSIGFTQSVEIIRDTDGIPHILGETVKDCGFGLTIAMFQDHPKYLIDNILTTRGEMAQHYGQNYINQDLFIRSLRFQEKTTIAMETVSDDILSYLDGLATGVNYGFATYPEKIPSSIDANSFLPVTVSDIFTASYIKALTHEWNQFQKDASHYLTQTDILPDTKQDMSNQWVVSPERTADDALYLLCDPHLPFNGLTGSWSAHLKSADGTLNYNGFFFLGGTHPVMGHNETFAWSHTANQVDFADAFLVSLDPNVQNHYLLDGISKPFNTWTETIAVAGGSSVNRTAKQSDDHGVFVQSINGSTALFAKLEVENLVSGFEQGYRVMTSESVAEWEEALSLHQYDKWNCMGGDIQGNLLFIFNGHTHYRNDPIAAREGALDGSISSTLWLDVIPFSSLPRVENPAPGYMQNCNDAPWYVTPDPGFGPDDVPIELYEGDSFGVRGRRVVELLDLGGDSLTTDYLKNVAIDYKILGWDSLKQILPLALEESAADSFPRQFEADSLANVLFTWNGKAEITSTEMSLLFYLREILPENLTFVNPYSFNESDRRTLVESLVSAKDEITSRYGTTNIQWGDIHGYFRGNNYFPLSGGTGHDLAAAKMGKGNLHDDNIFHSTAGNDHIMLIRIKEGETPKAWAMKPNGQSEDPTSIHYDDLTEFYSLDSLKERWYDESDIMAHAESIENHTYLSSDSESNVPLKFALYPAYPNPFNPTTTIRFSIVETRHAVSLQIYDTTGRLMQTLIDGQLEPGNHKIQWDASNYSSGIYFIRVQSGAYYDTQKIILIK
ncbi:MAG: penicillin acylase family protein [Candidatus Marinimicrobia bacterium]|nr:penicillin acylase family protein [Candidatus Neomarinimicrobiota bacterium]